VILFIHNCNRLHLCCNRPMSAGNCLRLVILGLNTEKLRVLFLSSRAPVPTGPGYNAPLAPSSRRPCLLLIRNKPSNFFVVTSLKLFHHTYAGTQLLRAVHESFEGSNGSDTCLSNEVERKFQIRTNMWLQRALE